MNPTVQETSDYSDIDWEAHFRAVGELLAESSDPASMLFSDASPNFEFASAPTPAPAPASQDPAGDASQMLSTSFDLI